MDWYERTLAVRDGQLDAAHAAFDEAETVRYECARLDQLPDRLIRVLARDDSANVRAAIAARNDLDGRVMDDLSWDANPVVRATIASRRDLPDRIRDRLKNDMDARVLDALGEWDRAAMIRSLPIDPAESGADKRRKGLGRR